MKLFSLQESLNNDLNEVLLDVKFCNYNLHVELHQIPSYKEKVVEEIKISSVSS